MSNVKYFISHDVTGSLIFGDEFELFLDYEELKKDGKEIWVDTPEIMLSKGAAEIKKPLPIVSTLSQLFIDAYKEYPGAFALKNEPDKNIIPLIIEATIKALNLHPSHVNEEQWILPKQISNEDYLFVNDLDDKKIIFPLTFEIANMIGQGALSFSRPKVLNLDFVTLMKPYKSFREYLKKIRQPAYLMNQRFKELTFKPVALESFDIAKGNPQHSFAISSNSGILSLAWAELYLASFYKMPFSVCTYCGKVYRLSKNINPGSCDNDHCKRSLRSNRDLIKREEDPESEREKDRKRQQLFRDKRKTKELAAKGQTAEEITSFLNSKAKKRGDSSGIRTIDEIKKWIKEAKE